MTLELLEKRFAFAADLLDSALFLDASNSSGCSCGGSGCGICGGCEERLDYYDGAYHELHISPKASDPSAQQADPANPNNTLNTLTPTTLAETFKLHSNPGATKRIYLDFDGHITSGTVWNAYYAGGKDIVSSAFDLDGNTTSFNDAERTRIQLIWERVSEDYIPFNVDVTTEDPGAAALSKTGVTDTEWGIRIVIGGGSWWTDGGGGITYVGSFNWSTDTPGFVFPDSLGNGNEKYVAEAISHEAGHSLGLNHDGRTSPSETYYAGHGSGSTGWAPIMGNGYYQNLTQWSKGEYLSANNKVEDDLSIITMRNGFTYRNDDHGNTNATASPLDVSGALISDWGIIERTTDVDTFSFSTGAGTIQINANPLDRGPNLDIYLELYDLSNNLLASSNPTDLLSASISVTVTAQSYILRISGTGKGDPLGTGYSNYASLGQYFLSGTLVAAAGSSSVAIAADKAAKPEGNSAGTAYTFVVTRTGDTSGATTANYTITGSGTNAANASDFAGGVLPSGSVTFAAGETSKTINILIAGDTAIENDEGFTVTLSNSVGSTIATSVASGLIQNDDSSLSIAASSATKTEGNSASTAFTFVVTRSGDSSGTTTVNYTVTGSGNNAANASDFAGGVLPSGSVTFAAGETSKTITILIAGDTFIENDEGFTVTLSNVVGSTIATSVASGLIQNDDSSLSIAASSATKAEGNSGSTAFNFVVTRSGDTSGTTTVNYTVTGSGTNAANASDFAGGVLPSGSVTFAAGETSKTITILIAGDTVIENDEGFTVTLSNVVGSTIATSVASGLIQNDDSSLSLAANSATKSEGNSATTAYTFVVTRTGDTSGATTVDYAVSGSGTSAANATDFSGGILPGGSLTFAAGETSKTITILVAGDTDVENDEGFTVTLANVVGSTIATSGASGLIQNDDSSLSVAAGSTTKSEGNSTSTAYTFMVTRTGDTSGATTVNYAVTGSGTSAANATDFSGGILPGGSLTFAAGETSKTITILVAGDTAVENDEGFTVTLANVSGSSIATSSASGLIQNDDGSLAIEASGATKAEGNTGNTAYTFVVTRTGDTSGVSTVDYAVTGSGTNAASATDFSGGVLPSGSLTFAAGETSKLITVLVAGDTAIESDEGFTVTLRNASGSSLATSTAVGLIQNDDSAISIAASSATKPEGSSGSTDFTFVVTRSGDASGTTTVNYMVTGPGTNAANASDFAGGVLPSGSLTFAAGETSKTITLLVAGDTTIESDEGFTVTLSNASGSTLATSSADGLIQNDDSAISIAASSATKAEGNSVSTAFTFVVTRSGDTNGTTTVNYAVTGSGTNAANASDFAGGVLPSGSLTFAAGETSKTITILVAGDTTIESDEGFTVTLSNASGSTLATSTASGLIQNDDSAISIAASSATKAEGNSVSTAFNFVITRSGNTSGTTTVNYAVTGSGTNAASASDFASGAPPSGSLSFAAGETSKTITIQVAGDTTIENDEGFTVTLSGASGSTLVTSTSNGLIQNDDSALSIAASSATKAEGNSGSTAFTFAVTRSGDTSSATTVNYAVVGSGTNAAGAGDFASGALPSGSLTFAAGETSKTITILVAGDTTIESDEDFTVTLSNASGSSLAASTANGQIQNDDVNGTFLSIVAENAILAEGNSGKTSFTFVVTRSGDTSGATTVNYAVTGSGSNPSSARDFSGGVLPKGVVNFAAGETSKSITILVAGETVVESDEGFTVTLATPSGTSKISGSTASGLILNDDGALAIVAKSAAVPAVQRSSVASQQENPQGASVMQTSQTKTFSPLVSQNTVNGKKTVANSETTRAHIAAVDKAFSDIETLLQKLLF